MSKKIADLWIEKYPHPPLPNQIKEFERFVRMNSVIVKPYPFAAENIQAIGLFNIRCSTNEKVALCNEFYGYPPMQGAILIYWTPLKNLYKNVVYGIKWPCIGTILTSQDVGYVYRNAYLADRGRPILGCKKFFGQSSVLESSVVNKYILDQFMLSTPEYVAQRGIVFDSSTNQKAHLPLWCKRLGVGYIGYTDEENLSEINNKLAQVDLPMVQASLF